MGFREADVHAAAVQKGDRVTADDIESQVKSAEYDYRETLTTCYVTLLNGYKLVGTSACYDPKNYDRQFGEKLAYDDAMGQAWPLYAFARLEAAYLADQ